jgi:uncharacterized protein (DUF58 family)
VLGVLGWWFDWPELLIPAAGLGAAFLVGVVACLGESSFRVTIHLSRDRVTVGQPAEGLVRVVNERRRRSLPAALELPVGNRRPVWTVPSLRGGGVFERRFEVDTSRRALVEVGPARSVRGDPLGLVTRSARWCDPVGLYVRPATVPPRNMGAGLLRDLEGQATRDRADSDLSFHTVREYRAGDDRRHIAWKPTARLGSLMVREFEDTRLTQLGLALATDLESYSRWRDFELAVSVLASLGLFGLQAGFEVRALAGAAELRAGRKQTMLDDCCPLEASTSGWTAPKMVARLAQRMPAATLTAVIAGREADSAAVRAAARSRPTGARSLIVTASDGAPGQARALGALSAVTIGRLEDLPRLLAAAVSHGG